MVLLLLVAVRSGMDLVRGGPGADVGGMVDLRVPAIAALTLSLLGSFLIARRIRRQLSVRFDGFGVHYRRQLAARVLPWRAITGIAPEPHPYGTNIRIESGSTTLTIVGGYYPSDEVLLRFLESQLRYHARIEARVGRG